MVENLDAISHKLSGQFVRFTTWFGMVMIYNMVWTVLIHNMIWTVLIHNIIWNGIDLQPMTAT
jgi:hypothetical protein